MVNAMNDIDMYIGDLPDYGQGYYAMEPTKFTARLKIENDLVKIPKEKTLWRPPELTDEER